jgi:transcriptional regulator with XRE-family HTH domain
MGFFLMEVYEKINRYLKAKKMTKKEFALRLLGLEAKLKNTGSTPSENTIYAYLNGRIGIKIELIPYIAEVLDVPEQFLFDDSSRARKIFLKTISESMTLTEKELLRSSICEEGKILNQKERFYKIQDLLIYAPGIFLQKLEAALMDYKELTLKFQ